MDCVPDLTASGRSVPDMITDDDYFDVLSGRDLSAVNKTVDGLLKLLYPHAETAVTDEDVEWAVRIALECRRRVREQQRRIGAAEFRNTQFGYRIGEAWSSSSRRPS